MNHAAIANGAEPAGVVGDSGGAISIGLTKRELLAAMAMQGMCSERFREAAFRTSEWVPVSNATKITTEAARTAVAYADALLAELAKQVTP